MRRGRFPLRAQPIYDSQRRVYVFECLNCGAEYEGSDALAKHQCDPDNPKVQGVGQMFRIEEK
jgi:hypothetical protein